MKNTIQINYTMTFDSPFHIGTGMRRGLIDRGVARDGAEYLYIPGSTIKGILREKCEQIVLSQAFTSERLKKRVQSPHLRNLRPFAKTPTIVERIFGSPFQEGTVYFDNAVMAERPTAQNALGKEFFTGPTNADAETGKPERTLKHLQVEIRTQNSISRRTGTAIEDALFRSEFGIRHLVFNGAIYGTIDGITIDQQDFSYAVVLLVAGLRLFDRIGANKSTGMGNFTLTIPNSRIRIDEQERSLDELLAVLDQLDTYNPRQEDTP